MATSISTVGVQPGIVLVLPPVRGQRLPEVAGAVVQANADQRQPEIGGRFEVVAGEDAQAAGIDRQHLGHAELHREVADALGQHDIGLRLQLLVPPRFGQVLVEFGGELVDALGEPWVRGEFLEPGGADLTEQGHRVAADLGPQLGVDAGEQILAGGVPGPPQIRRQLTQRGDPIREVGTDGEPAESLHRQ
jgi:hypothetical protein